MQRNQDQQMDFWIAIAIDIQGMMRRKMEGQPYWMYHSYDKMAKTPWKDINEWWVGKTLFVSEDQSNWLSA